MYKRQDINDLEVTDRYSQRVAYGNAKLENILFTFELHRRFHEQGISAVAFHPVSYTHLHWRIAVRIGQRSRPFAVNL